MASSQELTNSTIVPLGPNGVFEGRAYRTVGFTSVHFTLQADKICTLTIEQTTSSNQWQVSDEFSNEKHITTVVDGVADKVHLQCSVIVKGNFFRVRLQNTTADTLAITRLFAYPKTSVQQSNIDIRRLQKGVDNVSVYGENSNFVFSPTAANNTSDVYADGTKGTDVLGGWQYANLATGKINWYCYVSPTTATDYKVSQLKSMYTVINQQSTLGLATAQNPWIMIYTRPDTGTNNGAFYKNKLFFGSNAQTDTLGERLLYTGEDPVDVHTEITTRIKLEFVSALSNNVLLADVQEDSIMWGSLQTTNNTTTPNSFFFTMSEFGCDWVKTPALLPINNGRVLCDVTGTVALTSALNTASYSQAVSAGGFTGTAYDMRDNSVVDVLLLASSLGFAPGAVRLDYSIDGITWFPDNTTTYSFSASDYHQVIHGLKTGSRYIRVSTGAANAFRTNAFTMIFSSKRD